MASYQQPVMQSGEIHYKRKYKLWILILLVIVCWPAAILYYFTREKVPVQELHVYGTPASTPMAYAPSAATPASASAPGPAPNCPRCGRPATWVAQNNRWFCSADQQYL